jgi:formylglycine-generating enzyme required for sulfatase activity
MHDDLGTKIAQLEALRPSFGDAWVDAQIAALQGAAVQTSQRMEVSAASSISASPQISTGGELRDSAIGQGNLVLRDIMIEPGGTLAISTAPANQPPPPEAVARAVARYLETLLERYRHLNLQGLGAGGHRQVRIGLRSVFINVRTDQHIAATEMLFSKTTREETAANSSRYIFTRNLSDAFMQGSSQSELRRWVEALFNHEEQVYIRQRLGEDRLKRDDKRLRELLDRLQPPRTALELIRHEPALVLLGDPGGGKTTVLRYLAMGFAHARLYAGQADTALDPELAWDGPLPLPVLVQLRRFAEELTGPPDSADHLLSHIERILTGDRLHELAQHLLQRLEAGELVVLLDGLDEIADDARRAWARQAVALFQSRFAQSRLVVTSRIYAYRDACVLPPVFRVATLQPLDPEAQRDFVRRWYQAALLEGAELTAGEQRPAAADRARELLDGLDRRPRLGEIAANPLLLTMICLVHQHRLRLPQQRAKLYEECLLLLLEQWEQRRADGAKAGLAVELGVADSTDRLALVQPLAYQLQLLGREEATQREVQTWLLERFLDLADNDGNRAKQLITRFLDFLEGRSGLLIARDIKARYAFPHRTFQEYLVARELIYQGDSAVRSAVVNQRHAPPWREVILLIVGHLVASGQPQAARALGWALLEADPEGSDGFYRSVVLAGDVVEELGSMLGREGQALKDQVVTALVELVQAGRLSAKERVEAAFLLGRLGDPRLPTPNQSAYWCPIDPGLFWFGDEAKAPLKQVELSYGYQIARYPVTNQEYAQFIADGGYEREEWWTQNGWRWRLPVGHDDSWENNARPITRPWLAQNNGFNSPTQPVVGVSWYEAAAYCIWLTRRGQQQGWLALHEELRLPTSLEWERAARHTDQRIYPWGDDMPTIEHANFDQTGINLPAPVGCFPRGSATCGAFDMAGNIWEWTATDYQKGRHVEPKKDFTRNQAIVLRTGDYSESVERLRCGSRWVVPRSGSNSLGFRVIRSLRSSEEDFWNAEF